MTQGISQVPKEIRTAPNQNPNQEYSIIADESQVFCEDEQRKMNESDCREIGDLWYSRKFLKSFQNNFEATFIELEKFGSEQADFFVTGRLDLKKLESILYFVEYGIKHLQRQIEKVGV